MEITNNDVKVLGRIAAITVDGVVADAQQIYDESYSGGQFQSEINANVKSWINDVVSITNSEIDLLF